MKVFPAEKVLSQAKSDLYIGTQLNASTLGTEVWGLA